MTFGGGGLHVLHGVIEERREAMPFDSAIRQPDRPPLLLVCATGFFSTVA